MCVWRQSSAISLISQLGNRTSCVIGVCLSNTYRSWSTIGISMNDRFIGIKDMRRVTRSLISAADVLRDIPRMTSGFPTTTYTTIFHCDGSWAIDKTCRKYWIWLIMFAFRNDVPLWSLALLIITVSGLQEEAPGASTSKGNISDYKVTVYFSDWWSLLSPSYRAAFWRVT